MIYNDSKGGKPMPEKKDKKLLALEYLELELKKLLPGGISTEEESRMAEILKELALTHKEVIAIAESEMAQ